MSFLQDRAEAFFIDILKQIHLSNENKTTVELYEHHIIAVLNVFAKAKTLDEIRRILEESTA